ncbi:MAG TPA: efflux RND transporter periplasmic adaptor subunit [Terriglobia bacterium]|nr:efflux RND transporter periplasmic adaptor subunit [Terriglobia bacterium]
MEQQSELAEVLPPPRQEGPEKRRRRLLLGIALAGATTLLLFLIGYLPRIQRQRELELALQKRRESLPVVNVSRARRAPATSDLLLPGEVQAMTDAPIYARADGYVRRRYADIGDRMKQGQVLAEIETPDLDQQVQQARAALQQARAALAQAEANLAQAKSTEHLAQVTAERWRVLVARGVLARQDGDQKQADYEVAVANRKAQEANVNAAGNNVSAAEANLGRLLDLQGFQKVIAPFSGLVTARNFDVGALVASGAVSGRELFHMAQINVVRIFVHVPQSSSPFIRPGLAAEVTVQQLPARKFTGKVVRTSESLDSNTRTLLTEVDVPNPDAALLPGMYAQVRLLKVSAEPPLLVPGDALVTRADGIYVAVAGDDGLVHFAKVLIGRDYGTETEVLSGLRGGEQVIINPTDDVREGVKVRPKAVAEHVAAPGASSPSRSPNREPDSHAPLQ